MIIDSKVIMQPPPPYAHSAAAPSTPLRDGPPLTLTALPPHLLLHTIYLTFPQSDLPDQGKLQRQRKTLYWLALSLRRVDRRMYIACMHILRSTYIPAYATLVRQPYSSDPFPLLSPTSPGSVPPPSPYGPLPSQSSTSLTSTSSATREPNNSSKTDVSPVTTLQRETTTIDLFIALKVRQDVLADESELHLEPEEAYKDLFDLKQPKARLEDLVRVYGVREGVVCVGYGQPAASRGTSPAASTSSVTVHIGESNPQEPTMQRKGSSTESKPRLFSTYSTAPSGSSPPPSYSSSSIASSSSLTLANPTPESSRPPLQLRPQPQRKKSTSFFTSLFRPRSPPSASSPPLSSSSSAPSSPYPSTRPRPRPLPFHLLSVSFTPRQVGLVRTTPGAGRRTIVSVQRTREESLERTGRRLVRELGGWLEEQQA